MRFGKLFVVALGCLLLVPVVAAAQTTLAGQVSDNTGGVLPGVTVEAASPALIEGSRVAVTDGTGQYTIIDLRPGLYSLTFTLPGFGTQVRDELQLSSDTTMTIDVAMSVGSIEESVTVSGESPVVDVQQVERTEVLTREVLAAIPTGNSLYSFGTLVPGIRTSLPDIGGARAMEQVLIYGNGAGGMDTTVLVDGMQVNSAIGNGAYQMYFNPQMNAEIAFTTAGAGADTQRGGIRVNMIPKDGGNIFSGTAYFGGSHRDWQSSVWTPRFGELGVQSTAQGDLRDGVPRIDRVYDLNMSLGGPIVRDKLWFFGSLRDWSTDLIVLNSFFRDGSPGKDDNRLTSGLMRLTYQANSRNKFSAYLDRIRKVRFHEHGEGDDIETASQKRRPILYYTAATKWTGTLSNRVLAELGFSVNGEVYPIGYQPEVQQTVPSDLVGCFVTPCFPAVGSAQAAVQMASGDPWYGGPSGIWTSKRDDRLGFDEYGSNRGSTVNYPFKQNIIGAVSYVTGSHNIKVGFETSWSSERVTRFSNANLYQQYGDDPNPFGVVADFIGPESNRAEVNLLAGLAPGLIGDPINVLVLNDPTLSRVEVDYDTGFYAQDSWTLDRLTLNYGGRIDVADIRVPGQVKDAGRFTPSTDFSDTTLFPEVDFPRFGPTFSPRVSVAYDAFGTGKTALKFGWNRYQNAYGDSFADRYQPSLQDGDRRLWNDIQLGADGLLVPGCSLDGVGCPNDYGTNGDNIAQDWEIGTTANTGFGIRETDRPSPNLSRGYQDLLTIGIQQEVRPGWSVSAEWRRREFKNNETGGDNVLRNFSDFTDVQFITAPLPYVGTIPLYNIDPAVRALIDEVDDNISDPDYRSVYTGFELSFNGRLDGGGTVFGGWSMDTPGVSWFSGGGVSNNCPLVREIGDNPNQLRFCDQTAYPTPYRHEFKIAGAQPLPWWDLQVAGAFIANAGGYAGDVLSETMSITRTGDTYRAPWWNETNCVAPGCVLGASIITTANGGVVSPTVGTSVTTITETLLPGNSVKFPPYWIQLDMSIAKAINIGRTRMSVRAEGFNLTNAGFERNHRSSRVTAVGRQSGIGEYASTINNGRILRLSVTTNW